jgi:hypothetical protein
LDSAYSGNTYEKALSCLCALRSGCVVQQVWWSVSWETSVRFFNQFDHLLTE